MKNWRKWSRALLVFLAAIILVNIPVLSAQAMSSANKKARKAFAKQLKKDKKEFCIGSSKLDYAYVDVDGDKVDELIIYPGYGYCSQVIYDYRKGKVKEVCVASQGNFTKYYKKNKVIYVKNSGHQGVLSDYYYKWKGSTYKLVASKTSYYGMNDIYYSGTPEVFYSVNGKTVSAAKYRTYTKKLIKGAKAYKFASIKWKKY